MKCLSSVFALFILVFPAQAQRILIPMDDTQRNHLKAYGAAFKVLEHGGQVE
jgi:hypothetical protein